MENETEKWLKEVRQTPEYSAEGLVLDFIGACEVRRNELGLSYANVADRMGVSRACVNKLMNATQQSSIGLLIKLAEALNCNVDIKLVDRDDHA
jgi:DNA-binding XRE family transcriptional regulator